MRLSSLERKILNCIQSGIPLEHQPFKILSKRLGIKEGEFIKRIKILKARGIIRSFGASINHKKLGFKSSLVGLKVAPRKVEPIAKEISNYSEVTHCFLRKGEYNLWFVFIYKDGRLKYILNKLNKQLGRENILNLPTKKKFKLKTTVTL